MTLATQDDAAIAQGSRADAPARTADGRPPPKAICVLLPVWGDEYITKILDQSLPTLLAPGNVPALAQALPTRFVFLSRARDLASIRDHPAYERLRQICNVEILPIDDLITRSNHSTTVTLAYARAVRQGGESMLDTCFFFLVSDYIMADGSLAAVLRRMQAGTSAVQAGNFQLDEEAAEPWLLRRLADAGTELALKPREVMRWALGCLHPLSAANLVNYPLCHNTDANRLLWTVDANTLIGRFYLLHMICIRPELVDFVIGASCDYSFVPEMCPSGNVETMTDSDDYLVVEIQPSEHESRFLRLGPGSIKGLARNLSEWTTAGHRANADQTIVFHADALPATLPRACSDADDFIRHLTPQLTASPQPHRHHPYWLGAIAAFETAVNKGDLGGDNPTLPWILRATRWVQYNVFGRAPVVGRVHPRWRDYAVPLAACQTLVESEPPRLLIGASRHTALTEWLRSRSPDSTYVSLRYLMRGRPTRGVEPGVFDSAFIELLDHEIAEIDQILRLLAPLLRPGGQIALVAINGHWFGDPEHFGRVFAASLGSLVTGRTRAVDFHFVWVGHLRWWINNMCVAAASAFYGASPLLMPLNLMRAALMFPFMALGNLISSFLRNRYVQGRIASSVFIRFHIDPAHPPDSPNRPG